MADISQRQRNNQARQVAKTNVTEAVVSKNRPGETAAPANDNVPSTQRGGAPVIQNPSAVNQETGATLPKNIQESLQNQAEVKRQTPANDNFQNEEQESSYQENSYNQQNQSYYPEIVEDEETEEGEEEEENNRKIRPNVRFPWIVMVICIFEWFGTMLFALLGFVFSIPPLTPIGVGITFLLGAFTLFFSLTILAWSIWYEAKEVRSFKVASTNLRKNITFKPGKRIKRRLILGVGVIPYLGPLIPVNALFVYRTYRGIKKELEQSQN